MNQRKFKTLRNAAATDDSTGQYQKLQQCSALSQCDQMFQPQNQEPRDIHACGHIHTLTQARKQGQLFQRLA